jgi:hypothetical protein
MFSQKKIYSRLQSQSSDDFAQMSHWMNPPTSAPLNERKKAMKIYRDFYSWIGDCKWVAKCIHEKIIASPEERDETINKKAFWVFA